MASKTCLLVKSPNQLCKDLSIECSDDWTVLQIKSHLSNVYPGNPAITAQRIIYSGRLLQDHLTTKDFLHKYVNSDTFTHTIHLVCSTMSNQTSVRQPVNPSPPSVVNTEITATPPQFQNALPTTGSLPQFDTDPNNVAQQVAFYHQMYAQYLAQYPQFAFQAQFAAPVSTAPVSSPNPQIVDNAVNDINDDQRQPAAAQPQQENMRINAAGGMNDDDDEFGGERDWLDWFYYGSRALMLFSLLYFYSSIGRLMIVAGITILLYLYRNGWISARWQNQGQQQQEDQVDNRNARAADDQDQRQVNDENNREVDDTENNPRRESEVDAPAVAEQSSLPNFRNKAWTFMITLFTSLIPEPPQAVLQN